MTTSWSLSLCVQSKSHADTKALADALTTDEEIHWSASKDNFVFHLRSLVCKQTGTARDYKT